jgi:VCBS repeat-containing protein
MLPGLRAAALLTTCLISVGVLSPATAAPADRKPKSDRYAATEDVVLVVTAPGVLRNDRLGAVRRLSVTKKPAHGTVALRTNGSFTYTPAPGWSGTDAFTYRVVPKKGKAATARATVVVAPVDDPTVVGADAATTPEDTATSGNVLANDTDPDGPLTVAAHDAGNAHGTFAIQPTGAWTYTPDAHWSGSASVGYTTSTGATGTLAITVTAVDDATRTAPDAATVAEDTVASGNLLANDSDVDTTLTVASHDASGAPGIVGVQPDGAWIYTPAQDFHGTATVGYTTNTGATGTLTITVTAVDDPTTVVDDGATTPEDSDTSGNVLDNDSDVDGPLSVATYDDSDAHGDFTGDADGDWSYTPDANWNGTATVDYTTDTGSEGTLTITVTAVNDPTVLVADTKTVNEDNQATGNVLANDSDPDDPLTVVAIVVGSTAVLPGETETVEDVGDFTLEADGDYTFTPVANWNGTFPLVSYGVSTGDPGSTLTITVIPVNDAPNPFTGYLSTASGVTEVDVFPSDYLSSITDPEGDAVSLVEVVQVVGASWQDLGDSGGARLTKTGPSTSTVAFRVRDTHGAQRVVNLVVTWTP